MTATPNNKLSLIIKDSGLESTKAKVLLDRFSNYFQIASEWENKARMIKVTSEEQTADMQMARTGRLFLREKRIAIEKTRKELKEQSLREGKAIDGIANVLKAVIVPIEEYLDSQEHFVEIREAKRQEQLRIEAEEKAEKERLLKEKQEAEERERVRKENEKLRKELEEREAAARKERAEAERKLAEERQKAEAIARKEREEANRKLAEEKRKAEEARVEAQKAKDREVALAKQKAEAIARRKEAEERLANLVECPNCHHKFAITSSQGENDQIT